ncbi:MAG: hypothetical protein IKP55_07450, partial [Clostridia bacterium]|nr:hypothetical protein [Clostridia bacterium]
MQFIIVSKSNRFVNPFFQNQENIFASRTGAEKSRLTPLYNKEDNSPERAVFFPSPAALPSPLARG